MPDLISYRLGNDVAAIAMDDGKVNAVSPEMLQQLMSGLEPIQRAADSLVGINLDTGRNGPRRSVARPGGPKGRIARAHSPRASKLDEFIELGASRERELLTRLSAREKEQLTRLLRKPVASLRTELGDSELWLSRLEAGTKQR